MFLSAITWRLKYKLRSKIVISCNIIYKIDQVQERRRSSNDDIILIMPSEVGKYTIKCAVKMVEHTIEQVSEMLSF